MGLLISLPFIRRASVEFAMAKAGQARVAKSLPLSSQVIKSSQAFRAGATKVSEPKIYFRQQLLQGPSFSCAVNKFYQHEARFYLSGHAGINRRGHPAQH